METALLQQKIEFLEMEVEEIRRREENLKKINNSLMQAINNEPVLFKDHNLNELQKANDQYISEINQMKKKHKEEISTFEKQLQELFLSKKELQIDNKHLKTAAESEKYEFLTIIKQLESEKFQLEKNFKRLEENESVLQDRKFKENQRLSLDSKNLNDSRFIMKENEQYKSKIEYLNSKLKSKKEKIKRLKERNNERALRVRIEEMEEELETYKMICKKNTPKNAEVEKSLRKELDGALNTIASLKNKTDPKPLIMKKDLEIQQLKEKLVKCIAENERLTADCGRINLKLQQNEIYWKMADQKRAETELALKNEIKFLIGKLLKAKSKLGNDDSKEVTAKPALVTTVRSQSVKKDLKMGKGISPLDLSSITRSDSPFCVSNLDI
jgi:hypothetical protein